MLGIGGTAEESPWPNRAYGGFQPVDVILSVDSARCYTAVCLELTVELTEVVLRETTLLGDNCTFINFVKVWDR